MFTVDVKQQINKINKLIWLIVGQWSTVLAVGAGGVCLGHFYLVCQFSSFSISLGDTVSKRRSYLLLSLVCLDCCSVVFNFWRPQVAECVTFVLFYFR